MSSPAAPQATTWEHILAALRNSTTSQTFDYAFNRARLVSQENGDYTIAIPPHALEWVEHRLKPTLSNAIAYVTGQQPTQLIFTPLEAPPPTSPPPAGAGHYAAALDYDQIYFATGGTGFDRLPKYITTFWQPYLLQLNRAAWPLWLHLLAADPRRQPAQSQHHWTTVRRHRVRELARVIGCSPNTIRGCLTPCYTLCRLLKEDPGGDYTGFCCQKFSPTKKTTDRLNQPKCLHWRTGALEHLYHEGLALVQKSGDMPRTTFYHLQACRILPILTPAQLDRLHPYVQIRHEQWLNANTEKTGLSYDDWENITALSLVPLMPGHDETKSIHVPYQPNPLLQLTMSNEQ